MQMVRVKKTRFGWRRVVAADAKNEMVKCIEKNKYYNVVKD